MGFLDELIGGLKPQQTPPSPSNRGFSINSLPNPQAPQSGPIGDPNFKPVTDHTFQPYGNGMTLRTMDHPTITYNPFIKAMAALGQSPYDNGQPNYHPYMSREGAITLEDDGGNGAPIPYNIPMPLPDQPRVNWIHGMNNIPSANRQHLNKPSTQNGIRSI